MEQRIIVPTFFTLSVYLIICLHSPFTFFNKQYSCITANCIILFLNLIICLAILNQLPCNTRDLLFRVYWLWNSHLIHLMWGAEGVCYFLIFDRINLTHCWLSTFSSSVITCMELSGPPILNSDQPAKCKKEQKTFRFEIELNEEEDYEVSYFDLIERHLVSVMLVI